MHPYVRVLHTYMTALGESDYTTLKSLFVLISVQNFPD
jgi:hypothetical protein